MAGAMSPDSLSIHFLSEWMARVARDAGRESVKRGAGAGEPMGLELDT
jgi:hypothetical protein